jgi:hypothetical protein
MTTKRALPAALFLALFAGVCGVGPDDDKGMLGMEGQVFATATFGGGTSTYGLPVAGAVVSTSLDATTATTDASGSFRLVTTTPNANVPECMRWTLTITAAGHPTYSLNAAWGPSDAKPPAQKFSLSPPSPTALGCQCPNPPPQCSR